MVTAAVDLAKFVQQRELATFEAHSARVVYAYGVDLRRGLWLDHSTVGEPLMRAVDRRWSRLTHDLTTQELRPADDPAPTSVMEELSRLASLLRTPAPSLRLLRGGADPRRWPIVTPLGTTKGGARWLVLDVDRLVELEDHHRTYVLASNLGHLQCDHGPLWTAHLAAARAGRGLGLVRLALRAWTRVAVFSADRAAMIALGDLQACIEAMRLYGAPEIDWWPRLEAWPLRARALEDFDKSRVMVRLGMIRDGSVTPGEDPDQADADDEAAAGEEGSTPLDASTSSVDDSSESSDPVAEAEREGERLAAQAEAGHADVEAQQDRQAEKKVMEEKLKGAWPLARCDQRLTRRLGLL